MVGAHLLYELTKAGEKVRALKRPSSNLNQVIKTFEYYTNNAQQLFDTIEWFDGDMLDYDSMEKALAGVQIIYHCAAIVSFDSRQREQMISGNVQGTANIVDAAIANGVKRICHVSSIAALGKATNGESVTELTSWVPSKRNSSYSESKFHSETEIWRGIEEGLDAVIVNPSIIFGPANWESGSAKIFKSIWDGMKFYTKGVTGFVDVEDVVKAMLQLSNDVNFEQCKNERYLLNAENKSYQEVFFKIADVLDKPRPSIFASDALTGIVWRLAAVASFITRRPSLLTREAVTGRNAINLYDGSKISSKIDFSYLKIEDSIKQTAGFLKKDMQ